MSETLLFLIGNIIFLTPACYLIVCWLTEFDGPFNLFKKFRYMLGVNVERVINTPDGKEVHYDSNGSFWAEVVDCQYCLTPYIVTIIVVLALFAGLLVFSPLLIIQIPLLILSISGSVMFLVDKK